MKLTTLTYKKMAISCFNISRIKLEEAMETYSSVLAWRFPMDGRAWWAAVYGVAQSQT